MSWLFFALLSALFAALTAIFAKLGLQGLDSDFATFIRTLFIVAIVALWLSFLGKWQSPATVSGRQWLFLALSAAATGLSWLFYFKALQLGQAAHVAPVDKLSVVFVAIFAVTFLGERARVARHRLDCWRRTLPPPGTGRPGCHANGASAMSKRFQLLVIGNEILRGRRQDVHFANTLAACNARGLSLAAAHFLGDDAEALVAHYRRALAAGEVVLSFGGIGATPDDRTRQAVAAACDVPLAFHPEGEALLLAKFGAADFTPARRELIHFPQGASLIPNPVNNIPGFSLRGIHCVPGFPQMAQPMMDWVLDTFYRADGRARHYAALDVFAPESQLVPLMRELERVSRRWRSLTCPSCILKVNWGSMARRKRWRPHSLPRALCWTRRSCNGGNICRPRSNAILARRNHPF